MPMYPGYPVAPFAGGMSMSFQMSGDPTAFLMLRGLLGQFLAPGGPAANIADLIRPLLAGTPAGTALNEGQALLMLLIGQRMTAMEGKITSMDAKIAKLAEALKKAGFAVPPELLPPATSARPEGPGAREADAAFRRTLAQIDAVQSGRPTPTNIPSTDPDREFKRLLAQIDAVQNVPARAAVVASPAVPVVANRGK
jgi:hypothetical protein